MIVPPLTIYCDESGTLNYSPRPDGRPGLRAHVVCAVAVPQLLEQTLRDILPRDGQGTLLKHREIESEDVICRFLAEFLRRDVAIVATQIDTGSGQSIRAAVHNTKLANDGRAHRGIPRPLKLAVQSYRLFLTNTVAHVMASRRVWGEHTPSFLSIVMDENNHSPRDKEELRQWLVSGPGELGVRVDNPRWSNEGADPLLLLPDLVAGALRERGEGRPLRRSGEMLTVAESCGRVRILDGWQPKKRDVGTEGASSSAPPASV